MDREHSIEAIEATYPTDSASPMAASIGAALYQRAQYEVGAWRDAPEAVLRRYAELCLIEAHTNARRAERNTFRPTFPGEQGEPK